MPEVVQELFVYLWKNREKTKKIDFVQSYVYAALRFNSIRKFNSKTRDRMEIAEVPEEEYQQSTPDCSRNIKKVSFRHHLFLDM
jgi:DNA-directed RNA polymerase specialized sigma24 family protein